jgi:putative lipoprotein
MIRARELAEARTVTRRASRAPRRAPEAIVTVRDAVPLCLLLLAVACTGRGPRTPSATVTGDVRPPAGMAVPPDAVVEVQLLDVSRADAPATVLARQNLPARGQQAPFRFVLRYDPAAVRPGHRYTVSARIRTADRLLFVSDTHNAVLTDGAPATVDVAVVPVRE